MLIWKVFCVANSFLRPVSLKDLFWGLYSSKILINQIGDNLSAPHLFYEVLLKIFSPMNGVSELDTRQLGKFHESKLQKQRACYPVGPSPKTFFLTQKFLKQQHMNGNLYIILYHFFRTWNSTVSLIWRTSYFQQLIDLFCICFTVPEINSPPLIHIYKKSYYYLVIIKSYTQFRKLSSIVASGR